MMKQIHIFILLLLIPCSAISSEYDSEDNLHTFFTSSSERSQLDQMRQSGRYANGENRHKTGSILHAPVKVELKGVVIRKNHKPVVFVNDSNTLSSREISGSISVNDRQVKSPNYKVPVRINQQALKLKPGQQWTESERQVKDNYQIKASNDRTSVTVNAPEKDNN